MGFILDGLGTEPYDREYSDRELVRRILGYFRPYVKRMALVAGMIAANSLVGTVAPILVPPTISMGTPACCKARITPMWAKPRAPPPPNTRPTARPVRKRASRSKSLSVSQQR